MRIAFRLDSSHDLGTGHVARCLTLARELRGRGTASVFVSRPLAGHVHGLIEAAGFPVVPLDVDPAAATDDLQAADARATRRALEAQPDLDAVVVDHYDLGREWETALGEPGYPIMAVDDLDRAHAADIVLDPNLPVDEDGWRGRVSDDCRLLLGPRFAMLRPVFAGAREEALAERAGRDTRRLLVFMGGSDAPDATSWILEALAGAPAEIDVVVGVTNAHRDRVEATCGAAGHRYFCQVENLAEPIARADLAIGAGGGSSWERCCLGLPAVLIGIAPNQRRLSQALADFGAAVNMGDHGSVDPGRFREEVLGLLGDTVRRSGMSGAAAALVDGNGTARVAEALLDRVKG